MYFEYKCKSYCFNYEKCFEYKKKLFNVLEVCLCVCMLSIYFVSICIYRVVLFDLR